MLLLAGCDTSTNGGAIATSVTQAGTAVSGAAGNAAAADYCTSKGGQVVTRYPAYGTNGNNPLRLSGSLQFCQFLGQDETMIAISLDTLYTEEPTLAALAYLQKPPVEVAPPSSNPATVYCSKLGGSDAFGGDDTAGGGWVVDDKNDPFYVLQTCIFPDRSTIDSWGLTYHSNGTIRGTDLSKVLRFQMPETPTPGPFRK